MQYFEDEFDSRVLTPNSIIHGRNVYFLEDIEEPNNPSKRENVSEKQRKLCGRDAANSM